MSIAYLRAVGARDAVLGLLVLRFLATGSRAALGTTLLCSALAGASDFTLVATTRGSEAWKSLCIHGAGTIGLLAAWRLVASDR